MSYLDELGSWHTRMNDAAIIPSDSYRRNASTYILVCYINIIGCCLSRNLQPIPIFMDRARRHMQDRPSKDSTWQYYRLVENYLSAVETALERDAVNP